MDIRIKLLTNTAKVPTRGSQAAAGYDLYADIEETAVILPHDATTIGTGIAAEIPDGYFGAVYARSGIARERYLRPSNCVGVIDSDYRGEIKISVMNDSDWVQNIKPGERIAQLVIQKHEDVELIPVRELSETDRGSGGFGSTGVK